MGDANGAEQAPANLRYRTLVRDYDPLVEKVELQEQEGEAHQTNEQDQKSEPVGFSSVFQLTVRQCVQVKRENNTKCNISACPQ